MKEITIIIAGIGGVGGYFGGMLAKHYENNQAIKIKFLARGEHLKAIQKNGLKVITKNTEFTSHPAIASNNAHELGIADYILICTKSYDLETTLEQLRPCINDQTILLPLLNGVDSKERIEKLFPNNLVLDGCVYIVARLTEPGIITNSGNIQTLFFGSTNYKNERLIALEQLLKDASIEATFTKNIQRIIWEKFIFISATATATSYFNCSIGELLASSEKLETLVKLIEEIKIVAKARQITISENITESTLTRLKALPFETTTSMHSDFKSGKLHTESDSLTGYVIREAEKHNLKTPIYKQLYTKLKQ
jgi:2-dehydropantoate 2-reductase